MEGPHRPGGVQDGIGLSQITLIELYTGIFGSYDQPEAKRQLAAFLRSVTIIPLNQRVILGTARLRYELRTRNLSNKHRTYDFIAAATAVAYNLTLVTSNLKEAACSAVTPSAMEPSNG